jgi:phenylpyruvate tautomerase PptA (4-oxalocrotonate tautomerase family)
MINIGKAYLKYRWILVFWIFTSNTDIVSRMLKNRNSLRVIHVAIKNIKRAQYFQVGFRNMNASLNIISLITMTCVNTFAKAANESVVIKVKDLWLLGK